MTTESAPRTALVFPGQGSQRPGMGQQLAESFPVAREVYEQASRTLGYDVLAASRDEQGELADTTIAQPAILVHGIASWRALHEASNGIADVVAVAGHSLGEISALVCAGALDLERAVTLVHRRARLMADTESGGMSVVFGLPQEEVRRACAKVTRTGHVVALANVNSDEQTVVSGHHAALEEVAVLLGEQGAVVRRLDVGVAPHSPLMERAVASYTAAVRAAAPVECAVPVVSSIDGHTYRTGPEAVARLVRQLTDCVSWPAAVAGLLGHRVDVIVELGPKSVLRDLTLSEHPALSVLSCGDPASVAVASRFLTSSARRATTAVVSRRSAEDFLTGCLRLAVGTPSPRRAEPEEFDRTVRRPYEELRTTLDEVRRQADGTGADVVSGAAQRLLSLLEAKGIPADSCRKLVGGLAGTTGVEEEVMACLI
ncbi:ACP S-malonyltransferase [Streptomyces sp. NPDC056405]|uniref:ACP S-malonyltransferase n=1 Tax=Streptomyces sp. NPDC056405 TaxID=3345811 RepID=UPI0035D67312